MRLMAAFLAGAVMTACGSTEQIEPEQASGDAGKGFTKPDREKQFRDIAGEYFPGHGLGGGEAVTLKSDRTFRSHELYCIRGGADDDTCPASRWSLEGEIIVVRGSYYGRFVPVRWGDRRYLVPQGRMVEFCSAINQGWGRRSATFPGTHLLRSGDKKKPAQGLPVVPQKWRSYLLKEPVVGGVLEVTSDGSFILDIGTYDGIKKGMQLIVHVNGWPKITVIEVQPSRSLAERNSGYNKGGSIERGASVSTNLPRLDQEELEGSSPRERR